MIVTDEEKAVEFLKEMLDKQGVAVSTFKNGTLLAFKRTHLVKILEAYPDDEKIIIFVKKPDKN